MTYNGWYAIKPNETKLNNFQSVVSFQILLSGSNIVLLGGKEDIQSSVRSPRTNISINISLIYQHGINKGSQNKLIYKHRII